MKKISFVVACVILGFSQSFLHSQTWVPTASGTYSWNSNANWSDVFPNAAGAVANVNNNISGAQTINLNQAITVGVLNFGDVDGTHVFTIGAGGGNLTFNSGSGSPAQLNVRNAGTITHLINAPVTLLSNLNIDLEVNANAASNANSARLTFGGSTPFNLGSHTMTVSGGYSGPSDANQLAFNSGMTGNGTIINNSLSPLIAGGNWSGFTGTIIANGLGRGVDGNVNTISINAGTSLVNATEMVINGSLTTDQSLGQAGGGIRQGSGASTSINPGPRFSSNRITFNGGTLEAGSFTANAVDTLDVGTGTGTDTAWRRGEEFVSDTVATMDFNSGGSKVSVEFGTNTAGTRLTATNVIRGQGATVSFRGGNTNSPLGSGGSVLETRSAEFLMGNGAGFLVGAGGAAGTQTMSIIPWMAVAASSGNTAGTNHPQNLATYGPNGVRALTSAEYATSITAGSTTNVSAGTVAGGTNAVINALRYTGDNVTNIGSGNSLTISSGALIFTGATGGIGIAGDAGAGTLNFGVREAVVWTNATNATNLPHNNTIGAVIAGSGGFTKSGAGNLILTGNNTYSGTTVVASGTLQIGNGVQQSSLGDSNNILISNGALLSLLHNGAIVETATLTLQSFGLLNGRVNLASGVNQTVGGLFLGESAYTSGTFGAVGSGATFESNQWFSGSGILTVVPEPGTFSLLALAGVAFLGRRRRK